MSKTYEFLRDCGIFFLTSVNEDRPAARPFGAVMEYDGELYISTGNTKDVYFQIKKNPNIQIVALKHGTRDWIRVQGKVEEVFENHYKQAMIEACPRLQNIYTQENWETYALFKITDRVSFLSNNDVVSQID